MRTLRWMLAIWLVVSVTWLAFEADGWDAVLWVAVGVATLVGLVWRGSWPAEPASRARRKRGDADRSQFPRFATLRSQVGWAIAERAQFDRVLRPQLWRLLIARVTTRYGEAAAEDHAWIRARIGDPAWQLLDPSRPAWVDHHGRRAGGPDVDTLRELLDRIEQI